MHLCFGRFPFYLFFVCCYRRRACTSGCYRHLCFGADIDIYMYMYIYNVCIIVVLLRPSCFIFSCGGCCCRKTLSACTSPWFLYKVRVFMMGCSSRRASFLCVINVCVCRMYVRCCYHRRLFMFVDWCCHQQFFSLDANEYVGMVCVFSANARCR